MILVGTLWENFVHVINEFDVGDIVTRKNLYKILIDSPGYVPSTIDNYRRMITVLGYISEHKRGQYTKIKDLPETITANEIKRQYAEFNKNFYA